MTVPTLMFAAVLALVACAIAAEKWTPAQVWTLRCLYIYNKLLLEFYGTETVLRKKSNFCTTSSETLP